MDYPSKVDTLEDVVSKYVDIAPARRQDFRRDIMDALYSVDTKHYPKIDVVATLSVAGEFPPKLKNCPCCSSPGVYWVSQARFLKPEYINSFVVAGCNNCGLVTPLQNIAGNMLAACERAAKLWNLRLKGGD